MLAFYRLRAIPGLERVDGEGMNAGTGSAISSRGCASARAGHSLQLSVHDLPPTALPDLLYRVRRMWDLDADMQRIGTQLGQDPLLARLQARWPGFGCPPAGMSTR